MSLHKVSQRGPSNCNTSIKRRPKSVDDCVEEIAEILKHEIDRNIRMKDLSVKAGWSTTTINIAFKKHYGLAPKQWLLRERLKQARYVLLALTDKVCLRTLSAVLAFPSTMSLGEHYRRVYGETPQDTIRLHLNRAMTG